MKGILSLINRTLLKELIPQIDGNDEFEIFTIKADSVVLTVYNFKILELTILKTGRSISFILGTGIPFIICGLFESAEIWNFNILLISGIFLTFIFTGISFLIAVRNENRIKGFGIAILVWLFLAVIYDGLFLLSLIVFNDYPIEKLSLFLTMINPIDLSRILVILKMDISALLGYTGAVFNKFFGTNTGTLLSLLMLVVWTILPIFGFLYYVKKKDF